MKILLDIYRIWLQIYPKQHREDFGEEIYLTTRDTLMDASKQERALVLGIWLQELFDVVPNAIKEHIRRVTKLDIQTNDIKGRPEWYFFVLWAVLNGLTFPAAFFFSFPILNLIGRFVGSTILINGAERITEDYLGSWIILPLFTILTGLIQFNLLRDRIKIVGSWFWITAFGWQVIVVAFGLLLTEFLRFINVTPPDSLAFLYYGWIGLVLGFIQWLILRNRFNYAGIWIAASFLGWMTLPVFIGTSISSAVEMFAVPFIPAIFTAFGLWALFLLSPHPLEQNI